MPSPAKHVLIAGAGPVGMMAALELSRRGVGVEIVDGSPGPSQWSKALGINPRSLELLEPAGLTEKVIAAGNKATALVALDRGGPLARIDFSRLDHRYNHMVLLPQSETEQLLETALGERGVTVRRSTEVVGLAQDADGVRLSCNAGGSEQTLAGDALVAADGAHSFVRKTLGIGFPGGRYPGSWHLADLRMDWPHPSDELRVHFHPGFLLLVLPLPGGWFRVVANIEDPIERLPGAPEIHEVGWSSVFSISHRVADRFQDGRVFLAGDAAHVHSPAGGRGMNLGLEDAAALARRLADGDWEDYSQVRRPIAEHVINITDSQTRMATLRNPLGRAARNWFVRLLLRSEQLRRRLRLEMAGLGHPADG